MTMKFTKKIPQHGDVRVRTFFAWWPVTVWGPTNFTRWLETVTVEEELVVEYDPEYGDPIRYWSVKRFIDEPRRFKGLVKAAPK